MQLINITNTKQLQGIDWSIASPELSNWYFPWLDSDFEAIEWKIKCEGGKTISIRFDDFVPTTRGTLSDKKFLKAIITIKKILVLARTGISKDSDNESLTTRADSMASNANSLKILLLFLIKNYGEIQVSKGGFELLTKDDLDQFYEEVATGRADKASGLYDEVIKELKHYHVKPQDMASLLKATKNKKTIEIKFTELFNKLGIDSDAQYCSELTLERIRYYFHELFPDLNVSLINKEIKNKQRKRNQGDYPNACPPKIEKGLDTISQTTFERLTFGPKLLAEYAPSLPELSKYSYPTTAPANTLLEKYVREKGRTPNIPTTVALHYLNESIKLIDVYGDDIIATKKHFEKELLRLHKENPKARRDHLLDPSKSFLNQIMMPDNKFTQDFKVSRYNELPHGSSAKDKRDNVTILFAFKLLCAATYILIHTFCIKRISEVLSLRASNLEHGLWGGYEIFFGIRKASPTENSVLVTGRPIPNIVFRAYSQLMASNEVLVDCNEDPFLFLSKPTTDGKGSLPENLKMSAPAITERLIDFADFIELPTQIENGVESRYYLTRTHVLRRFGAKAFYSLSDLSDFPALSWLMGHRDTDETWRYLLEDVGNEEMTEEEAIAVLDALYKSNVDSSQIKQEAINDLGTEFKNLSRTKLQKYIEDRISNGETVYTYVDESTGKRILILEPVSND